MRNILTELLETSAFPLRWHSGAGWTTGLGRVHIISDVFIFGAYFAIPIVVAYFVSQRKGPNFPRAFWLWLAAVFCSCGMVHLIEALTFYWPAYRLSALVKVVTAIVSWAGVVVLARVLPVALELKRPKDLQREVDERKRAETALRDERFFLHTLLDHLPDAIYFKDVEGRFLRISREMANRLALDDPFQAIGKTDADFFPADYAAQARADEQALLQSRVPLIGKEEHPVWPNGSRTWVSTIKSPLIEVDGRVVGTFGLSHDVTELKETETALRASEERFSLAVQGSSDGLWDWNVATNEVYYSPRFKELLGYKDSEFPSTFAIFQTHLHPDDVNPTLNAIQAHLERREPYDVEYRLQIKSGGYRWFRARGQALWDGAGRATRMSGSITDVTDSRRAEERFRLAVEASPSGMLIVDREGRVLLANSQAGRLFGYQPEELVGTVAEDLVAERYWKDHPRRRGMFFSSPRVVGMGHDLIGRRKDGSEFDMEVGLNPLETEEGLATLCSVIDVTERNLAVQALKVAKNEAEAANQAKSDFLANMSHEIRTPMNGVIGLTELVLDTDLTSTQRDYLKTVLESADSLLSIINGILDFSKIESGHVELESAPFNIRELIGDALKSLGLRANAKQLELAWRVALQVPDTLRGDPVRLRQIIVNLAGNAVKFTDEGEVVVDVDLAEDRADDVLLHVRVRDTGIGIPADRQEAIFTAFTQADMSTTRRFGGTGLGLSISSTLAHLMGGRIWVESEVGKGSTFHFTVRCQRATAAELAEGHPVETADLKGLRSLVVDDNATNRQILVEMLSNWGLHVQAAEGAQVAFELLQREYAAGTPVRLVVTDLHMPGMDGFSLAERIRNTENLAGMQVLLLTSGHRPGDSERCEALGLAAHLTKPVKQSALLEAISRAVGPQTARQSAPVVESHAIAVPMLPRQRILLAEDGLTNQKLAVGLLTRWGHTCTLANDGAEALAKLAAEPFDLILMDVQMPVMDGLEATTAIRSMERTTGKHIPIIAMTAHALKGDREKCLMAGMDGYVTKPIRKEELLAVMLPLVNRYAAERGAADINATVRWDPVLASVGGDRELLCSVLEACLEEFPQLLDKLEQAVSAGDATGLKRVSHTIRGSMRLFEVTEIQDLLARLDAAADAGDFASSAVGLEKLRSFWIRLRPALEAFIQAGK